jgi:hypothetical protein
MQPTPVKYYVFHFNVKRVHYKDRSPNGDKLVVVTLYFGVSSLPRVAYDVSLMIKWENVGK